MKITKIGLAIVAVSAILFVVGCTKDTTPQPQTQAPQAQPQTYHGKLGTTSTQNDVNK